MLKDAWNNPELERNILYRLRPRNIILTSLLTVAFCIFVAGIVLMRRSNYDYSYNFSMDNGLGLFLFYVGTALFLGCFYSYIAASRSVIGEKSRKTYDFLFMVPMSDTQVTIGKLLGSTIHMWFILGILTPFIAFAAVKSYAPVSLAEFFIFCGILLTGCVLAASIGLLLSSGLSPKSSLISSGSTIGLVIIAFIAFIMGFSSNDTGIISVFFPTAFIARYNPYLPDTPLTDFFGISIDKGLLTIALYAWLSLWVIKAIIRRIRNPYGTYLKPWEALVLFVGLEFFLLGIHWNKYIQESYEWNVISFSLIFNGIIIAVIMLLLTLNKESYLDYLRNELLKRPVRFMSDQSPPHMLFFFLVVIFLLGIGGIMFSGISSRSFIFDAFLASLVMITFLYSFCLLVQLAKTIFVYSGSLIAILITGACLALPEIAIGVLNLPDKYNVYINPVSYIIEMQNSYYDWSGFEYLALPFGLTVLMVAMMAVFAWRHYHLKWAVARRMKE